MTTMPQSSQPVTSAKDVARYFLARAVQDGDLITNLKMQKLIYYAYAWTLVNNGQKLFSEPIEAWPNGPVVASLYQDLKSFGSSPIRQEFLDFSSDDDFSELSGTFPSEVLETLDDVYEQYMRMTAFDLVTLTHNEKPWQEARKGLSPDQYGQKSIQDEHIKEQFSQPSL